MNIKTIDLRSDAAENSIMQTITIAVSAILIAAGLVTAPGLINNARDNNATTDLANIAYAEEFNLANTGTYGTLAEIKASTDAAINEGGSAAKLSRSGGVFVKVATTNTSTATASYTLTAVSQSGKVFTRSSSSAATTSAGQFSKKVTAGAPDANGKVTISVASPTTGDTALLGTLGAGGWE